MAIKLKSARRARVRPSNGNPVRPVAGLSPDEAARYAEWVVQESETPVEKADAEVAALDGPAPLAAADPGFRGADRALRDATAAVHRADLVVEKETARAFKFVDSAFDRLK